MEVMMLHDNWPHYQMNCGATFTFKGWIDQEAFHEAVHLALRQHPLLRAVIRRSLRHQWVWEAACFEREPIWMDDKEPADFARIIPYQHDREPGWRIWFNQQDDIAKIFVEFHHTVTDGGGGMIFMQDVFGHYAAIVAKRVSGGAMVIPKAAYRNPELLLQRGNFVRKVLPKRETLQRTYHDLKTNLALVAQPPKPLAIKRTRSVAQTTREEPRYATINFDRDFTRGLRDSASQQHANLNDLMTRELLLILRDWNLEHAPGQSPGPLRIVIPMSLRSGIDVHMPATNRFGYAFITRNKKQLAAETTLLQTISEETKLIRRYRTPIGVLNQIGLLSTTRVGMGAVFSPNRCFSTAVLSNVGDPTRRFTVKFPRENGRMVVGNLEMTHFSGMTGTRPLTRAAFFFNTYGGRLSLSARVDPMHFTQQDAHELLSRFAERLRYQQVSRLRASA